MTNIPEINPSKSINKLSPDRKSAAPQKIVPENQGDVVSISKSKDQVNSPQSEESKVREWAAQAMALKGDSSGIERAKERLESGYYNDPDVLKTVVQRVTKELIGE
ncbi:MAG: hypothetical protein ACI9S8_001588 [Chlamydiales bacterium]|jgi:hypothetical protein